MRLRGTSIFCGEGTGSGTEAVPTSYRLKNTSCIQILTMSSCIVSLGLLAYTARKIHVCIWPRDALNRP